MNILFSPKEFFIKNLAVIGFLLLANITGITLKIGLNHDYVYGLVPLFNFNTEMNIPTLYSSLALVLASVLLFIIAFFQRKLNLSYIPWLGLSFIFLFLAIDETSSLHEKFTELVRETLNTSGLLFYAWVIPYGIGLFFFLLAYSKFLFQLPSQTMKYFILSGTIFVTGAIGFELLGGMQADKGSISGVVYSIFYTCEELFEMLGIAIFIYALLSYLVNTFNKLTISISPDCISPGTKG